MDAPPPPPPPPHGATPGGGKSGGLPDGKYDIFVIPPSSAGSGFLYLPSLQTQRNSFIAGVACTAAAFFVYSVAVPALKQWFSETLHGSSGSGSGIIVLMVAIAVVSWAWGKTQAEGKTSGASNTHSGSGTGAGAGTTPGMGATPGAGGFNNGGPYTGSHFTPGAGTSSTGSPGGPKPSWQRAKPQTTPGASAKTSWEKAREETRKKEEERKRTEELKKKREELEKERQKLREKEARERIEREVKMRAEAAARAEVAAKVRAAEEKLKSSPQRPPMPSARTEHDDDAYSFRPYDRPKHKANSAASVVSESSYAPSQTTAKTTPSSSHRGPYSTKDPDKIIIKAVYSFNNAFMKTPISQLISGKGNVTDGLILRITTEGLFIDDDVRGVPQREWDIKAWTMKLAEVWCPSLIERASSRSPSQTPRKKSPAAASRLVDPLCTLSREDNFFINIDWACREHCRKAARDAACESSLPSMSTSSASSHSTSYTSSYSSRTLTNTTMQSCELAGLHILRASIRDQEGKKYVFVLSQSEGWKVAVGLQRLRRGTQARALGVSGLPQSEAKMLIQNLGWA
jgi:hypothetical protein